MNTLNRSRRGWGDSYISVHMFILPFIKVQYLPYNFFSDICRYGGVPEKEISFMGTPNLTL